MSRVDRIAQVRAYLLPCAERPTGRRATVRQISEALQVREHSVYAALRKLRERSECKVVGTGWFRGPAEHEARCESDIWGPATVDPADYLPTPQRAIARRSDIEMAFMRWQGGAAASSHLGAQQ